MNTVQGVANSLTSVEMADIVKNSSSNNFFMYAFIIFALIMIVGIVSIVTIFIRKDTKKDVRQNEQYKNLLDSQSKQSRDLLSGYTQMISQNSTTNSEFRQTISEIGNILRELTNTISQTNERNSNNDAKFEIMFNRFESLSEEFREHERNWVKSNQQIGTQLHCIFEEVKSTVEACKSNRKTKEK